jgi:hypothetical protein
MDPILKQINPINILKPYLRKIHFNIIISPTPRSSEWSLPFRLSNQNSICISHLTHACYMSHFFILDLTIIIIFREKYKLWSSSLYNFLQPPVTSSLLSPVSSALRSQTSSLYVLPIGREID